MKTHNIHRGSSKVSIQLSFIFFKTYSKDFYNEVSIHIPFKLIQIKILSAILKTISFHLTLIFRKLKKKKTLQNLDKIKKVLEMADTKMN